MSNYAENICVAIDQIVTSRLEGLSYDITKLCTIVDDSEKNNGKYIVTDGATKFDAYSSDNNLREGNSVLVNIPNGDFSMQKTIIGKQTATNTQPFIYTAPLETMIAVESDITSEMEENSNQLRANDPDEGEQAKKLLTIEGNDNFIGFTRLGISADFQSWFSGYEVLSGQYGLKIYLTTKETNITNQSGNSTRIYELTLSNDDMYGNPYNFETYFNQEKVFDISNINNIEKVEVWFYQNQNFLDGNGNLVPYAEESDIPGLENVKLPYNLFVDNIKFYLGYDQNAFTEDALVLYTKDSLTYDNTLATEQIKNISLRWIHKKEDGTFKLITDKDLNSNLKVKWYRYKIGAPSADSYSGVYWTNMEKDNQISISFDPDITKATEEIKAIGYVYGDDRVVQNVYYSDLLIFENEHEVANQPTVDRTQALSILFEDESDGNYFIYNQNGKLIDSSQGSGRKRTMKVLFKGAELTAGMGVQEIVWYIPYRNSMIKLDSSYYVNSKTTIVDGEDVRPVYDYKYKSYYEIVRDEGVNPRQTYYIYDQWSPSYANNTIACYVKINNVVYETYTDVKFGKAGTNGSNVTFLLNFDYGRNSLSLEDFLGQNVSYGLQVGGNTADTTDDKYVYVKANENDTVGIPIAFGRLNDAEVQVSAHLYDAAGVDLNLDQLLKENPNIEIKWGWKAPNDNISGSDWISEQMAINESDEGDASKRKISLKGNIKENIDNNYNILKATLTGYGDLNYSLVSYLPIPIKTKNEYNYISGAKEVVYDHQGKPSYYNGVYNLYKDNAEKEIDLKWGIKSGLSDFASVDIKSYLPTLKPTENGYGLSASTFYIKGYNDQVCVSCKKDDEILWSQPILIIQNQYDFSMLNEWDGDLTINEENGTILSTMLGAGRKNNNNTFSGVLIGDIQTGTGLKDTERMTGVYGLHEGVLSYELKEDGTATFGKTGRGQIFIDGNESTIYSGNYEAENKGMLIDLDDGFIEINGTNKGQVKLSASEDPYFKIKSIGGTELIHIGSNNYFLQSDDYNVTTGMKIDLADGSIKTAKQGSGSVLIQPDEPFLQVQDSSYGNLIYMGKDNYYLQSSDYDGTIHKYGYYNGSKYLVYKYEGKEYAVIGDTFYTITGGSINSNGEIIGATISLYSFPTNQTYQDKTFVDGELVTTTKTYTPDQLKKIYKSKMVPVLTNTDPNGLKIDLKNGIILGYDLYLKGTASSDKENKFFVLDSGAPETPLQIGSNFKVDWGGELSCSSIKYLGTGPKTGDWVINIADNFVVNSSGGGSAPGMSVGSAGYAGSAGNAEYAKSAYSAECLAGANVLLTADYIYNFLLYHTHTFYYDKPSGISMDYYGQTGFGGNPSHAHWGIPRVFGVTTTTGYAETSRALYGEDA